MTCEICHGPLPKNARYNQKTCGEDCRKKKEKKYNQAYSKKNWKKNTIAHEKVEMKTDHLAGLLQGKLS